MGTIHDHAGNAGVIRSLCRTVGGVFSDLAGGSVRDPYYECGCHPEVVERIWDQLGRGLPVDCRRVLCGTPILVGAVGGLILAVGYGTSYCLRVPEDALAAALEAGCETSHRWGDGSVTDLAREFGPDWVFGCCAQGEVEWCRRVAASASRGLGRRGSRKI